MSLALVVTGATSARASEVSPDLARFVAAAETIAEHADDDRQVVHPGC
jgi:hypothetical protein